ncbi:hypothetical protein MHB50_18110 [Siminovitchia sp. FSL H7-0308]|uniref:hypothetical protein n=1 Tax=Siminovitchia sp. FSL H7-0308 TaxID=2921432 RepID=UPI0030ECE76A
MMAWGSFFGTMMIVLVIMFLQWPKMKQNSKKDKAAFIVLLMIALLLSMFDLQHLKGPVTLVDVIFQPLGKFL